MENLRRYCTISIFSGNCKNFIKYACALGADLPQEVIENVDSFKNVALVIKVEGTKFTLTTESVRSSVVSFTLGEEFDEEVMIGIKQKVTITT